MSIRPSLFGRRTMTFLASTQPDGDSTVFIKDAWPVASTSAADDDLRNEIVLLRHIRQQFSSQKGLNLPYPQLEMGGTVRQCNHGQWEQDDATTAYGNFEAALPPKDPESAVPVYRVHRRMVMTPIARRLDTLKNFNELIVVLADAMACHGKLYSDCNILHCNISTNNIMVVDQDGRLRGMLIDFDNALHEQAQATPERTGTLPFMSTGNLENNDTERTPLDGWESLLYVVCWLGTYGLDEKARVGATQSELQELEIQQWFKDLWLAKNLRNKFGNRTVLVMGNWSAPMSYYFEPIRGKGMHQKLQQHGFKVYLLDEYKASKACPTCCVSCLQAFKAIPNPRAPNETYLAVMAIDTVNISPRPRLWNYDLAAVLNFQHILLGLRQQSAIPQRFQLTNDSLVT
ncbi:hypothetical protein H4R35_001365 [Dimargaris xerosporica]|nr:hypothetical protein H4R35_001365 [Dimargaris xerosporica]